MKEFNNQFSIEQVMQFIKTPAGKQLLATIQNSKDPNLAQAKELITKGDIEGAKNILQNFTDLAKQQGKG